MFPTSSNSKLSSSARDSINLLPERIGGQSGNLSGWRELAYCSTEKARELLPFESARRLNVLPLSIHYSSDGSSFLTAILPSGSGVDLLKEVKFAVGMDVVPDYLAPDPLKKALFAAYRGQTNELNRAANDAAHFPVKARQNEDAIHSDEKIPTLLRAILNRALFLNASDVHLEPEAEGTRIRFRVDGFLTRAGADSLGYEATLALTRRIKILAKLDTTIVYEPQEGAFCYSNGESSTRVRVSVIPQIHAEKVVMRLLHNSFLDTNPGKGEEVFRLLGMNDSQEAFFRFHLFRDRGAILLSGPTGSGKTTLLYSALETLNSEMRNIVTLEDPVERMIRGVNQTEIVLDRGLGYAELLPKLLRQDPDVIMIGEIRDKATAETALTAAITGSLVLSTVHAGNCLEVLVRLSQFEVAPFLVASAVRLIVSQRLVPTTCLHCAVSEKPTAELRRLFNLTADTVVNRSNGCDRCGHSGVSGRMGIFELLPITDSLRNEICAGGSNGSGKSIFGNLSRIQSEAVKGGYRSFAFSLREAMIDGRVSPDAALFVLGVSKELAGY